MSFNTQTKPQTISSINIPSNAWDVTPNGDKRGYIQPHTLDELWFHTGTKCNLACDFCLEGSSPSDKRLQSPKLVEVIPFIDEGLRLKVKQFSFTGGEPFLVKDIVDILDYASQFKPCLVLTNGTEPLLKRFDALLELQKKNQHPVSFRISLDSPNEAEHDQGRGQGSFSKAIIGLRKLHQQGFNVSIARHMSNDENTVQVEQQYKSLFTLNGLPRDLKMVAFPDFMPPGSLPNVPHITTHCMTQYQTEENRKNYMCANSKMVIKKHGEMQVYACTLVDDDDDYFLATTLTESMSKKISMKHHRCYSCFAFGASCSEM
jgi:MoaA/NifB/PqqE/SkfB family radical SAM enzyme